MKTIDYAKSLAFGRSSQVFVFGSIFLFRDGKLKERFELNKNKEPLILIHENQGFFFHNGGNKTQIHLSESIFSS